MKCKFALSYDNVINDSFDVNSSFFDETSYIDALNQYNNDEFCNKLFEKCKNKTNKNNLSFCNGELFIENNMELNYDTLLNLTFYDNSKLNFTIKLDLSSMEEEFNSELMSWFNLSKRINDIDLKYDVTLQNLPYRNLKIFFYDNYNKEHCIQLNLCVIKNIINKSNFMVIVDNLKFVKN